MISQWVENLVRLSETLPAMSYDSVFFLAFFAALLLIYWLMPRVTARQIVILIGNIFFYCYAGGIELLAVIFLTSLVVFASARSMGRIYALYDWRSEGLPQNEKTRMLARYRGRAKVHLLAGFLIVMGILIYIKFGRLSGWKEVRSFRNIGFRTIMVPLGVSYYTLSAAGYLLDIYWRKTKYERHYLHLLLSMTFFPTIVEGPICRYDKLMKQFGELPGFHYENICRGLQLMIWGLIKKSVIADRLVIITGKVFPNIEQYAGFEVVFAVAANVFCLYADFSGCMDIVCGAAECLGLNLESNFKQPFFAKSAAEFWRRWHVTLGAWFRDYVYMPFATSKGFMGQTSFIRKVIGKRAARIYSSAIPLMLVWILTGLWHGTGRDYVAWGLYWGILIVIETTFAPEFKKVNKLLHVHEDSFSHRLFQMTRTFVYFSIGRMITALGKPEGALLIIRRIFTEARLKMFFDGTIYDFGLSRKELNVVLLGIGLMWAADMLKTKINIREELERQSLIFRWFVYIAAIVILVLFGTYGPNYTAASFVYGNF